MHDRRQATGSDIDSSPSRRARIGGALALGTAVTAVALLAPPLTSAHAATPVVASPAMTSPAMATPPSAASGRAWIRFGHFASGNGPVKVVIDGKTVASKARFETVTPYDSIAAGRTTIAVSEPADPSFHRSATINVAPGEAVTVAALREPSGLQFHEFIDNLTAAPAGDAKVRLVDTASTQSRITVRLVPSQVQTTSTVTAAKSSISNVTYGSASPYINVKAGTYAVAINNETGRTIVAGHGWPVSAGTVASLVVVQSSSGPTLEVLRDAAGTSATPKGGTQTGFGGTAGLTANAGLSVSPSGLNADTLALLAGLLVLGGAAWSMSRRRGNHPRGALPRGAAVAAVVTAGVLVVAGCGTSSRPAAAPHAPAATPATLAPAATPARPVSPQAAPSTTQINTAAHVNLAGSPTAAPVVSTAIPTELTISSIGVHTPVIQLGRNSDGTAAVPVTTTVVGWYKDGPLPGQPGPAIIVGHVDSTSGPGVFFNLRNVQPGALVRVQEGTKGTVTFAVQQVDVYSKAQFPTEAVYGPVPDRALRLVTCGGPFDSATGHYLDNVVAYATEVAA